MADTNNQYSFLDYSGLTLFWNNIKKIIEDNEFVTATALTNLDTRVDTLEGLTSPFIMQKTYSELVELRNNGALIPGRQYRITDYETTTIQENTQSAGHQFDIIVTANDESTLNEAARAIQHDGDDYFIDSDLNTWQIWYCLDNDTSRFSWAVPESEGGKGVIYRMIDEFNNDCPYDFKNIQFIRYELNAPDEYTNNGPSDGWLKLLSQNIRNMFADTQKSCIWSGTDNGNRGWAPLGSTLGYIISSPTGMTKAFYTFSSDNDEDASLQNRCRNNKMSFSDRLQNNIFFGNSCYSNSLGDGCYSNTFGDNCYENTFGNTCYYNSFGNDCYGNHFDNACYSNTFANNCYENIFGYKCYSNSFSNACNCNRFGNNCFENSFASQCNGNSFGNNCDGNKFGLNCETNTFGNVCRYNSFEYRGSHNSFSIGCIYNSFGVDCQRNNFGISCRSNSFGRYCQYNNFGANCQDNDFGEHCMYNNFGRSCIGNRFAFDDTNVAHYFSNNSFDSDVNNIICMNAATAAYNQKVQNYHFTSGLSNTTIEVERNRTYHTTVSKDSAGNVKQFCIADIIK